MERREHADHIAPITTEPSIPMTSSPGLAEASDLVCSWVVFGNGGSGAPAAAVEHLIVQDEV
jgi:hypothetical protein